MTAAILTVHARNGLWVTENGFEYNLVLVATVFALAALGAGTVSLDSALGGTRIRSRSPAPGAGPRRLLPLAHLAGLPQHVDGIGRRRGDPRVGGPMDIGKPETEREIVVVPLEEPVPGEAPVEEPVPREAPVEPVKDPSSA